LNDGGFVTITSGVVPSSQAGLSFAAAVNSGLDGFIPAAAVEMPREIRVNSVSPADGWAYQSVWPRGDRSTHGLERGLRERLAGQL
jgi:NAD(P)-dependent dehydrogenase (short-subunit alcohol dehydrogenase family)